jgi:hypothetical protein
VAVAPAFFETPMISAFPKEALDIFRPRSPQNRFG